MNTSCKCAALGLLAAFALAGCGAPGSAATEPTVPAEVTDPTPTGTVSPEPTASPQPSLTPTQAVLDLEILEWGEFPIMRLADPDNTDTHVEVLIRNPNDFPVRIDRSTDELRLVNAAGEVVFTNPGSVYYIWEGEWMLPGETAALSACVCFWTSGLERQEFETLELVVPLEPATDLAYTLDVEVTLGEWFSRGGGRGFGAEINWTNTSDQVLEEFSVRVMARDANGRHVGVAFYGALIAGNDEPIQPGEGGNGLVHDNMIDYMNPPELEYEVNAIGLLVLPSRALLAEWEGIPIMPGAISGGEAEAEGGYRFSTQATIEEITQFYKAALAELGYSLMSAGEYSGITSLTFQKGSSQVLVGIRPEGGELNLVQVNVN